MDWRTLIVYAAVVAVAVLLLAPGSAAAGAVRSVGDGIRGTLLGGAG